MMFMRINNFSGKQIYIMSQKNINLYLYIYDEQKRVSRDQVVARPEGIVWCYNEKEERLVGKLSSKCMCLVNVLHCNKKIQWVMVGHEKNVGGKNVTCENYNYVFFPRFFLLTPSPSFYTHMHRISCGCHAFIINYSNRARRNIPHT